MNELQNQPRENWNSRIGVILAVMGSAVGLGNFLRFPGQVIQHGGGTFMIPYICAFLLLGIPIAWSEWAMGRRGGRLGYNSPPGIFRAVTGKDSGAFLGLFPVITPVMIYMYYVCVEGWCLGYAIYYLFGRSPGGAEDGVEATGQFFSQFAGATGNGTLFEAGATSPTLWFIIACFVLNFFLIYRGLTKGIEWFCKLAMPALFVCAVIILLRVLTLTPEATGGEHTVTEGLGFMWNPVQPGTSFWETLGDSSVWLAAAGQVFFSTSVAFGLIVTYASYVRSDDDVALSSLTAASGNGFCEVALGGLMIVPAAFMFLGPAFRETSGTFSAGFQALPYVFEQMAYGDLFGFIFFFLLFLAAVTSSLSMLQPAIALFEEGLGLKRRASVTLLGFITAVGASFVAYFSKGMFALDTFDFWAAQVFVLMMAIAQVILFGWVLNFKEGIEEIKRGAEMKLPRILPFVLRYITPVYLIAVFVLWIYQNLISPKEGSRIAALTEGTGLYCLYFILGIIAFFSLIIAQSITRWRKKEAQQ